MIMTRKMHKVDIYVLQEDVLKALEFLGRKACVQIDLPPRHDRPKSEKANTAARAALAQGGKTTLLEDLEGIRLELLGHDLEDIEATRICLPGEADAKSATGLCEAYRDFRLSEGSFRAELTKAKSMSEEARAFAKLNLPLSEIDSLSFLVLRLGRLEAIRVEELRAKLGDRALILELDDQGRIAAFSSKKGRFALESELRNAGFVGTDSYRDYLGVPSEVLEALRLRREQLEQEEESWASKRQTWLQVRQGEFERLLRSYRLEKQLREMASRLESSETTCRLCCWIPKDISPLLLKELESLLSGRIALRSYEPKELRSIREGEEQVPVQVKHGRFVSSFERLVFSYGTPLYGSIDPTPIVAFFFIVFFSIMFGDIGQGFILLLLGIFLRNGRWDAVKNWRKYWRIFVALGFGSMVMGFLDGSFFTMEHLLVLPTRIISKTLLGREMDRFIVLMPNEDLGRMLRFIALTACMGLAVNSIGLCINMYNLARAGHHGRALFSKTGLSGSLFFWYIALIAIRFALGLPLLALDAVILCVLALLLFASPALERLVDGKRPVLEDGLAVFVIQGLVEVIESLSYYVSNSVSFVRVGAFALSHALLSFVVFKLGDMVRAIEPIVGLGAQILIMLVGNAIIICLEGMVVAIQVVRLQYYEFFSKFFVEMGRPFVPFRLIGAIANDTGGIK